MNKSRIPTNLTSESKQASPLNSSSGAAVPPSDILGPWGTGVAGSMFSPIEIDGRRWDQLFPYRLLVVRSVSTASDGGVYIPISASGEDISESVEQISGDKFRLTVFAATNRWEYRLPITPQQFSTATLFAMDSMATLKGVSEVSAGVKFKMLSIAGSFGIWPGRPNLNVPPSPTSFTQSVFAGTLGAADQLGQQLSAVKNIISSGYTVKRPDPIETGKGMMGYAGTGYAQALLLDQFLEQYAELKKTKKGSQYRLALDIPKQNQAFLVTPAQFIYFQDSGSPNEYKFNLQLKAFRRIKIQQSFDVGGVSDPIPALSIDGLNRVLQSVSEARRALAGARNLVAAVRSDVNSVFNVLRETALFVKDFIGLGVTVADLPSNIISDSKRSIADAISTLQQAKSILDNTDEIKEQVAQINSINNNGQDGFIVRGDTDQNLSNRILVSPAKGIFDNPEKNFSLFDQVPVDQVNFPIEARSAIDTELERVSQFTVSELKQKRQVIQDLAYQISDFLGTGDDTFARIYGKPAPKTRLQEITIDEYAILKTLYDTIQSFGILTSTDAANRNENAAFEFVKAEATEAQIEFPNSQSKIRVPVPFGLTIEQIAQRYLNNQERWMEIAALNGLRSPYIDEQGFTRAFLSNGDGRQFNVASSENLYVGQKIYLSSNSQVRQKRTIISIEKVSDTNYLITVDGLDNLDTFTTSSNSVMKAYLPGTVNSQDQIFVPSALPVPDDLVTRPLPAAQDDVLTGLSKIDLLLTEDNDLAIDSVGDLKIAYGLTNLLQAIKMKFITQPGDLIRRPKYGAGVRHGVSNSDITAKGIYNAVSAMISQDPRFAGIQNLQVTLDGPRMDLNASVAVANGLGVYPISFAFKR